MLYFLCFLKQCAKVAQYLSVDSIGALWVLAVLIVAIDSVPLVILLEHTVDSIVLGCDLPDQL